MRAEVGEAYDPVERITDDQKCPSLANHFEYARNRTYFVVVLTLQGHEASVREASSFSELIKNR